MDSNGRILTVGDVASLAHVSVRTLHHYNSIGLLSPSERTRAHRTTTILAAIDAALDALSKGEPMDDADMFEVFGEFDPSPYEAEAKDRWGDTDAYAESARRTARYTKDDWRAIKAEGSAVTDALAARLATGASPADPDVQGLVDRHREHIDRWFYPCSIEMQAELGEMYGADPQFAATYERIQPGLAAFLRDAIRVRAGREAA